MNRGITHMAIKVAQGWFNCLIACSTQAVIITKMKVTTQQASIKAPRTREKKNWQKKTEVSNSQSPNPLTRQGSTNDLSLDLGTHTFHPSAIKVIYPPLRVVLQYGLFPNSGGEG